VLPPTIGLSHARLSPILYINMMRAAVRLTRGSFVARRNSRTELQKNVNGKETARANIAARTEVSPVRKQAHTRPRCDSGVQYSYNQRLAFEGVGGAPGTNDSIVMTQLRYYPF
jgi:hypothetical protein